MTRYKYGNIGKINTRREWLFLVFERDSIKKTIELIELKRYTSGSFRPVQKKETRFWNGAAQRNQDGAEHCTFISFSILPIRRRSRFHLRTFTHFSFLRLVVPCSSSLEKERKKKNKILRGRRGKEGKRKRKKRKKEKAFRARRKKREQNLEIYRILIPNDENL